MSLSKVSKKWLTTIPSDVRRSLGLEEGDFIMWEVDASRAAAIIRVVKDPLKLLKGKYSDPKLRYDVVEETADKIIMGMTYADNEARPPNSSS